MAKQVTNIESSVTQSASAWEAEIGVAAAPTAEWQILDLTSYSDGGAKFEATARSVMDGTRRAKKGAQTSKSATFGYNIESTITNTQAQIAAFMCNVPQEQPTSRSIINGAPVDGLVTFLPTTVAAGVITTKSNVLTKLTQADIVIVDDGYNDTQAQVVLTVDAAAGKLTCAPASGKAALVLGAQPKATAALRRVGMIVSGNSNLYSSDDGQSVVLESSAPTFGNKGLTVGQWVYLGDDSTKATNFFARISAITANALYFDTTTKVVPTAKAAAQDRELYFGTFITDGNTKLSSTHTRYLGVNSAGKHMRETSSGCMPNELTLNAKERSLITMDLSYMAMDATYDALSAEDNAVYVANSLTAPNTDAVNMSTDVVRQRLSVVNAARANTASIHSFVKESTVQIKNNLTELTANGFLGNVGASLGEFTCTGTVNTYFADLAAMDAVRCNCTVSMDWTFARKNQGFVLDIPALSLGAESVSVEKNNSIMLNLTQSAFESNKFGYTLSYTLFHYLPSSASPTIACDC